MHKWWKRPEFIGTSAHVLFNILAKTLRVRVEKNPAIESSQTYLFAFWHGKQILPSFLMRHHHGTPLCAMVSPSRDGAMLAVYLHKNGYEIVRGSSRDNGVSGLIQVKNKIRAGISTGFGVDGPIGPIYSAKPGIVFLAQKCGVPIVPIGSASNRTWIFSKAWDKFQLPKPFARVGFVMGQPFTIPKEMTVIEGCAQLEQRLHYTEQIALDLIG